MRYLERRVDPADQRVQDLNVVVTMQQDEGQESLQEGGLRDRAKEQIQVRSGGHHLLHSQLKIQKHTQLVRQLRGETFSEDVRLHILSIIHLSESVNATLEATSVKPKHKMLLHLVPASLRPLVVNMSDVLAVKGSHRLFLQLVAWSSYETIFHA